MWYPDFHKINAPFPYSFCDRIWQDVKVWMFRLLRCGSTEGVFHVSFTKMCLRNGTPPGTTKHGTPFLQDKSGLLATTYMHISNTFTELLATGCHRIAYETWDTALYIIWSVCCSRSGLLQWALNCKLSHKTRYHHHSNRGSQLV